MNVFHNYRGYKYIIQNDEQTVARIYDKFGNYKCSINATEVSPYIHKNAQEKIDKLVDKEIKRHISLVEIDDDLFNVFADTLCIGTVKKIGIDKYKCFPINNRYDRYIAKDIKGMMDYFRGVEKQIKEEEK